MALSKQTIGWCKVYLLFPFIPVIVETFLRAVFGIGAISPWSIPAYGTSLVCVIAVSSFIADELSRYRIPDPDAELLTELAGNRSWMMGYFCFSCVLFGIITCVAILSEDRHVRGLEVAEIIFKILTVVLLISFSSSAIGLQQQYRLSAP